MDPGPAAAGDAGEEGPSASSAPDDPPPPMAPTAPPAQPQQPLSRYESQKRRDWNTFLQYLRNHRPPLSLARCSGAHVIEFLKYLDQFGKTRVHAPGCTHFGLPKPPAPCACPLKQAWGSLDALIGRLRAAYDENDGRPESNPFGAKAVSIYLREVKAYQGKARGIPYEKKRKRKRLPGTAPVEGSSAGGGEATVAGALSSSAASEGSSAPPTSS